MPSNTNDVYANVRQEMEVMQEERHRVKKERQKRIPELQAESHQIRAQADEIRAQANQFMTDAHKANAGLKAHVSQFRAEVNRMVGAFAQVSHDRAASWKQTLNAVRGRKPGRAHAAAGCSLEADAGSHPRCQPARADASAGCSLEANAGRRPRRKPGRAHAAARRG